MPFAKFQVALSVFSAIHDIPRELTRGHEHLSGGGNFSGGLPMVSGTWGAETSVAFPVPPITSGDGGQAFVCQERVRVNGDVGCQLCGGIWGPQGPRHTLGVRRAGFQSCPPDRAGM